MESAPSKTKCNRYHMAMFVSFELTPRWDPSSASSWRSLLTNLVR